MDFFKLPTLGLHALLMNLLHNQEEAEERRSGNTQHLLSQDGIVRQNCYFNFDDIHLPLTCGESGKHEMMESVFSAGCDLLMVLAASLAKCSKESPSYRAAATLTKHNSSSASWGLQLRRICPGGLRSRAAKA